MGNCSTCGLDHEWAPDWEVEKCPAYWREEARKYAARHPDEADAIGDFQRAMKTSREAVRALIEE